MNYHTTPRKWYVADRCCRNGIGPSDTNNGTGPETPFKTIAKALSVCGGGAEGDLIVLIRHDLLFPVELVPYQIEAVRAFTKQETEA